MTSDAIDARWPHPTRILLTTYNRWDHAERTVERGVVGVRDDGAGSASKANRLRKDDWVLIRITEDKEAFDHLFVLPPARVTGPSVLERLEQASGKPWPLLLWPEEVENGKLIFPLRIPVSFEGSLKKRVLKVTWESLAALRFRGHDGSLLETSLQWGIKFSGNIVDARWEVRALVTLVEKLSA